MKEREREGRGQGSMRLGYMDKSSDMGTPGDRILFLYFWQF